MGVVREGEFKNKLHALWILCLHVIRFWCYCKSYCIPVPLLL